jgi:RHS repeat-associated protein
MSYLDPNNGNSIVVSDSGMIYANSLGTAYAPASYTGQPQFTGYVLQGYYSEENLQGVWSDVAYGISLEMGMLLIPNITVSTSGTPSAVGQPVTFTATVNNTSGPAPTGDIYFVIMRQDYPGWSLGSSTGTISGTTATYTTNALPAGTYDVFAVYSGDSNYIYGQVGNYFHQVVSASLTAPTLSLTTSSASSTAGHPVMFTANISSGATGVVKFLVDGTVIGSRTITSNSATFTTSALTLGTHSISANYSGNQNYSAASSNTFTQVVTYALQPSGTIDYSYTIPPTGGSTGYSSNSNLLSYTDSVNGTWSNIAYDGLNRLSAATQVPVGGVAQSYCWTYDSFGNRTTQATSNQPFVNAPGAATCQVASGATLTGNSWTSYTVNGADPGNNRVVATASGSYQPDAAGNILSDGVNGYTYDGEGRLCAVAVPLYTGGVILTQYIYDAAGTRVAKGTNTNLNAGCDTSGTTFTLTNTYVIGPSGEQLTETDGSGNWLHTNVYGAGKLLATYSYTDPTHTTTDTYFALSDWLGTKRAVVSAGGCGTGYVSLPYGEGLTPSNLPGFTQCPDATENHFTGKERDTESGNDYFGARYYNSATGRWLSPDWSASVEPVPYASLGNPQTLNLYGYALNNPLGNVDVDGHDGCTVEGVAECTFALNNENSTKDPSAEEQQTDKMFNAVGQQQNNGQKLKYKTVSGGQHSSSWEINWSLTHNTKTGGWVVQHIVADFEGSTQCGGHGQCNYWEAWPVAPNSHTPSIQGLDANGNSYSDMFGGGAGSHIHASASFYEGLTLPSSFTVQPEGFPSGILRTTTTNPNLPTDNATAPNVRWWGAP